MKMISESRGGHEQMSDELSHDRLISDVCSMFAFPGSEKSTVLSKEARYCEICHRRERERTLDFEKMFSIGRPSWQHSFVSLIGPIKA